MCPGRRPPLGLQLLLALVPLCLYLGPKEEEATATAHPQGGGPVGRPVSPPPAATTAVNISRVAVWVRDEEGADARPREGEGLCAEGGHVCELLIHLGDSKLILGPAKRSRGGK